MSEFTSRGKSYVAQGDRKLLAFGWFSNKYEEAADLFERGANQFKLAKACKLIYVETMFDAPITVRCITFLSPHCQWITGDQNASKLVNSPAAELFCRERRWGHIRQACGRELEAGKQAR